ncbi:hypothetical protein HPP92_013939, partial [Vanilla planifolia]
MAAMDEHEVYGGEIPDVGDMEGDEDMTAVDGDGNADADGNSSKEESLEDMKKRLKEIEEEANALREMQARVEKEMGVIQASLRIRNCWFSAVILRRDWDKAGLSMGIRKRFVWWVKLGFNASNVRLNYNTFMACKIEITL